MDRVGNLGFTVDLVCQFGVDVAEANALKDVGSGPDGVETQFAHLADAVAHPFFLAAAVSERDGALRHARDRMTDADAEKAVPVWSDQPPTVVDLLGVEEAGSFALDIEESAVSIELLAVGRTGQQQEDESEGRGCRWMQDSYRVQVPLGREMVVWHWSSFDDLAIVVLSINRCMIASFQTA